MNMTRNKKIDNINLKTIIFCHIAGLILGGERERDIFRNISIRADVPWPGARQPDPPAAWKSSDTRADTGDF